MDRPPASWSGYWSDEKQRIILDWPYLSRTTGQRHFKVTGYISGRGNHARLDSAYLTRRNSQTSQLGHGQRPRMCTMQTAKAVEDPCVHAETAEHTDTDFSPNRSAAANATSTSYVLKTCDHSVSRLTEAFRHYIFHTRKNFGKPLLRTALIVKTIV